MASLRQGGGQAMTPNGHANEDLPGTTNSSPAKPSSPLIQRSKSAFATSRPRDLKNSALANSAEFVRRGTRVFTRKKRNTDISSPISSPPPRECIQYKWKLRLQAVILLCILGIPGNVVTFVLFAKVNSYNIKCGNQTLENGTAVGSCLTPDNSEDYSEWDPTTEFANDTEDFVYSGCYEKQTNETMTLLLDFRYWVEGVLLSVIGTVGLLGNLITLIVLKSYDSSSFNTLLMILVTTDNLHILFYLMDSAFSQLRFTEPFWYVFLYPYFIFPLKNVTINASIYMVVAVAFERYHAICHPLKYKPSPTFYAIIVGAISFILNVPTFFEFEHTFFENGSINYMKTTALNEEDDFVVFRSYLDCSVRGILPLVALCYLNYKTYIKIRNSANLKHRYVGRRATTSTATKATARTTLSLRQSNSSGVSLQQDVITKVSHNSYRRQLASKLSSGTLETKFHDVDEDESLGVNGAKKTAKRQPSSRNLDEKHFQSRREKSTGILIGIILVFVCCHILRVTIQLYKIFSPQHGLAHHYIQCEKLQRLHVPATIIILGNVNHLFLVINSSVNFLIYCCMAKRFRDALVEMAVKMKNRICPSTPDDGTTAEATHVGYKPGVVTTAV